MTRLQNPKSNGSNTLGPRSKTQIHAPTPTPRRSRWRLLPILFIYGSMAVLLILGFYQTLSDPTPTAAPPYTADTITTPDVSDYVLLQDDRVATDGERLALELERDRVSAQITELDRRIAQADEQQQLGLLRQQQQLEIDRQAIDNQILEWNAERDARLADAEAEAHAAALDATAESQTAQAIRELAEARSAQAWAETSATITTAVGYIIVISIALLAAAFTVLCVYVTAGAVYTRVHFQRPAPATHTRDGGHDDGRPDTAVQELLDLMREIEARGTRPPTPRGAPVREPVTDTMTRGRHSQSSPVSDRVSDDDTAVTDTETEPKLNPRDAFSDADKRRILAAYHRHNAAVTPASRAVFGYANTTTNRVIRAVVAEMTEQGQP
jgi:hypothetical protein